MQDNGKHERRRYPRHALHGDLSVELRVEVSGKTPALLLTRGTIADISRGGVRCDIDFAVPVGTKVDLSFPDVADGGLDPSPLGGHVARTVSPGGVPDQVAIEFTRPLARIDLQHVCARELVTSKQPRTTTSAATPWGEEPEAFTAC